MKLFVDDGYYINTSEPIDISISIKQEGPHLKAWYLNNPEFNPVMENGFIGAVASGGVVNFRNIVFNLPIIHFPLQQRNKSSST